MRPRSDGARRRGEGGFALIGALVVAILYLGLMELVLIESAAAERQAQRFRTETLAEVMAENAAELAAAGMVSNGPRQVEVETEEGILTAHAEQFSGNRFRIEASGRPQARGIAAVVVLDGRVTGKDVQLERTEHR